MEKGENAIDVTLDRTINGLRVNFRTHRVVEDFMRTMSAGEVFPVIHFGRQWTRLPDGELEVYDIPSDVTGVRVVNPKIFYRLDQPGRALSTLDTVSGNRTLNMSFLRLVGSSSPEGVTFMPSGVHSDEDVIWLGNNIREAARAIYLQYMKPISVNVRIVDELPIITEQLETDVRIGGGF